VRLAQRRPMGASLSCCLADAACCFGMQALSCCGRMLQCSGAIGYPLIVFLCTLLGLAMRFLLIYEMDEIIKYTGTSSMCNEAKNIDTRHACFGNQFVYRLGFALVVFFSLMMFLVACFRKFAHDGAWCIKVLALLGILVGSLWCSDQSMTTFANACLYGSGLFIAIQVLCLLDWVYGLNERWRGMAEEDPSYFHRLLWTSIVAFVLAILFIILAIVQFAAGGCSFAAAEISWTAISIVGFSVLSVSGLVAHSSLMCSAIVALYATFYCWSGLSAMPHDVLGDDGQSCNTLLGEDGSAATWVNVTVGLILTCISLAWSAFSLGESEASLSLSKAPSDDSSSYAELSIEDNTSQTDRDSEFGGSETIVPLMRYHFIMVICSMFMTMTICNWDTQRSNLKDFGTGWNVVWVKTVSQWLTILLYTWTIIVPRVFELCGIEREFEFS